MSTSIDPFNRDASFEDSVDILIARYGYDGAIDLLHAALSRVKQERAVAARRGDLTEVHEA